MNKVLANQMFVLALVFTLTLGLPLRLVIFLVVITAAVALLANTKGMEVTALGLALGSLGLTLAVYEPNLVIWLMMGLLIFGSILGVGKKG
jgi:hypothetical protein